MQLGQHRIHYLHQLVPCTRDNDPLLQEKKRINSRSNKKRKLKKRCNSATNPPTNKRIHTKEMGLMCLPQLCCYLPSQHTSHTHIHPWTLHNNQNHQCVKDHKKTIGHIIRRMTKKELLRNGQNPTIICLQKVRRSFITD